MFIKTYTTGLSTAPCHMFWLSKPRTSPPGAIVVMTGVGEVLAPAPGVPIPGSIYSTGFINSYDYFAYWATVGLVRPLVAGEVVHVLEDGVEIASFAVSASTLSNGRTVVYGSANG